MWLQNPPPGEEDRYAGMTSELWGERARRLRVFAEKTDSDSAREAYLREADYFDGLRDGAEPVQRRAGKSLKDIAAVWFAKREAHPMAASAAPVPPVAQSPTSPLPAAKMPVRRAEPLPPVTPPAPAEKSAMTKAAATPTESGPSSELIIGGCVAVIVLGWAGAALWYLRNRR